MGHPHQPASQPITRHCTPEVLAALPWLLQDPSAQSAAIGEQYFDHFTERFYLTSSHGRYAETPTFRHQLSFNCVEGHHNNDCGACNRRHNWSMFSNQIQHQRLKAKTSALAAKLSQSFNFWALTCRHEETKEKHRHTFAVSSGKGTHEVPLLLHIECNCEYVDL